MGGACGGREFLCPQHTGSSASTCHHHLLALPSTQRPISDMKPGVRGAQNTLGGCEGFVGVRLMLMLELVALRGRRTGACRRAWTRWRLWGGLELAGGVAGAHKSDLARQLSDLLRTEAGLCWRGWVVAGWSRGVCVRACVRAC